MIYLKRIELSNFLSHKSTNIDFDKNCKKEISGKSGSGKSSIVDALTFSIYGKSRADNKSLIKKGEKTATVDVEFSDTEKGFDYKISRTISKTKHSLDLFEKVIDSSPSTYVLKSSGVTNTQELIEKEILHSSYLLFVNSIIYLQDNSELFVNQTASKRKEILLEIINSGDYDKYLDLAKEKSKELLLDKTRLEQKTSDIRDRLPALENIQDEKGILSDINNLDIIIKESTLRLDVANEERQKLLEIESKKAAIENSISTENTTTEKNNIKIKELEKEILDFEQIDISQLNIDVNMLKSKKLELSMLEDERDSLNEWKDKYYLIMKEMPLDQDFQTMEANAQKLITELQNEQFQECPELHKICPILDERRKKQVKEQEIALTNISVAKEAHYKKTSEVGNKLLELGQEPKVDYQKIAALKNEINDLSISRDLANKYETKRDYIIKIRNIKNDYILDNQNIFTRIELLKKGLLELALQSSKTLSDVSNVINRLKAEIEVARVNLMNQNGKLQLIKKQKEDKIELEKELDSIKTNLVETTIKKDNVDLVKEAFGNNGIKTIIIDYVIPELEDRINEILSKLSNFKVRLDTQKELMSGEGVTEGLFITVINEVGEEMDFSLFSGGEKIRISYAINSGLASLTKVKFCVMDEAVQALDSESLTAFLDILFNLIEEDNQLIVISHIQEVKDLFPDKIEIKKINGTSQLNN